MRSADITTRARIRSVALDHFAAHGVAATTVRSVAADAAVSPALIAHHFGSKEGLREAVDEYVVEVVTDLADDFSRQGTSAEQMELFAKLAEHESLLSYLVGSIAAGGPAGSSLFDEMMDRGVRTFEQMTADGVIREVQDATAMTLFLMSAEFGVLLLREHVKRHLGFDPFSPEGIARWLGAEMDLLRDGLLTGGATPTADHI